MSETKLDKTDAEKAAERLYENVYKAVLYIHREFGTMFNSVYQRSLAGKHVKKRIEEGLMRRWGISKYNNIYLQDELVRDPNTGNRVSIGPDAKTCDFTRTINKDGEIDKEKKKLFIQKYTAIYQKQLDKEREQREQAEKEAKRRSKQEAGLDKTVTKAKGRGKGRSSSSDKSDGGSDTKRSNGVNSGRGGAVASGNRKGSRGKPKGGAGSIRKGVSKGKSSS